jgi:hypothetical protein
VLGVKLIFLLKRGWQFVLLKRKVNAGIPAKLDRSIPKLTIPEVRNLG